MPHICWSRSLRSRAWYPINQAGLRKVAKYETFCKVQSCNLLRIFSSNSPTWYRRRDIFSALRTCGGFCPACLRQLSRALCRGLHLYPRVEYPKGLLLYHAAARLRAHQFNYLSLESVLSDAGLISQIPMQWISVMSSGRSSSVSCGSFGTIEFVHTRQPPESLVEELTFDRRCRLWRASTSLAIRDMRNTRRSLDLLLTETVS